MNNKETILFLCTGNSCRSQIAEGLFRNLDADMKYNILSAGLSPEQNIHPLAIKVMSENNIDISSQCPKNLTLFLGTYHINYLITVCEDADRNCPRIWPGFKQQNHEHWDITDPSKVNCSNDEKLELFRQTRDLLKSKIQNWISAHN